jgi:hypothetical protein
MFWAVMAALYGIGAMFAIETGSWAWLGWTALALWCVIGAGLFSGGPK